MSQNLMMSYNFFTETIKSFRTYYFYIDTYKLSISGFNDSTAPLGLLFQHFHLQSIQVEGSVLSQQSLINFYLISTQ